MLDRFKDEIGQEIDFRKCGYLFVLTNEQALRTFQSNVKMQRGLGVDTRWLSGDDVRKLVPDMSFTDALAGTFNPDDGLVDPNSVVTGYGNAARSMGVTLLNSTEVTGIRLASGRVQGVETLQGSIDTPLILNTAGPWSVQVGALAGVSLPIQPVRRQWFTTTPLRNLPADFPFVIDFAQSLYFHREGEGLLIGMSNQDEPPGFDQSIDEDFEITNLEAAVARMPMVESAGRVSHWAGLYEVTPDAHPIFGATPIEGFLVVSGFSGHGFMHGLISGKLISELIVDGAYRTLDVSMLDLARFAEQRLIQEYNVV